MAMPATPVSPLRCSLQPEHAAILVMQHPAVVKAKAAGGCPAADYEEKSPGLAGFQVRNLCAKSADDQLGSYLVELSTGQMWDDAGQRHPVDTPGVRTARTQVCSMSVHGVLPSLLPQGHASRATVRRIGTPQKVTGRRKATARRRS